MPQLLGNDFEWHSGLQGQAGGCVPQVVQSDGWEAGRSVDPFKGAADHVGVELAAVLPGEDQAGVVPLVSPPLTIVGLLPPPAGEGSHRALVERHGSGAAVGLRFTDLGRPAELDDLLADPRGAGRQVHVLPPKSHCLTTP